MTISFWDVDTSGLASSAAGVGRTTVEMQVPDSFTGWDFINEWLLDPARSVYPLLRWQ